MTKGRAAAPADRPPGQHPYWPHFGKERICGSKSICVCTSDHHDTNVSASHEGTYYRYCNASCNSAANWHEVKFMNAYLNFDFSLAFDAAGEARFGFRYVDSSGADHLAYGQCAGDCTQSVSLLSLRSLGYEGALSLAVDPASGHPRLAFYEGSHSPAAAGDNELLYAWCDSANCGDATTATWYLASAGLGQHYGYQPDLKLDGAGQPHVAYRIDDSASPSPSGLGYGVCTAGCETSSPTWSHTLVETADYLEQIYPMSPAPGCSSSVWQYDGLTPSLVLDGTAPRIVYAAQHVSSGSCPIRIDAVLVRFAADGAGSWPGVRPSIWLPLLSR